MRATIFLWRDHPLKSTFNIIKYKYNILSIIFYHSSIILSNINSYLPPFHNLNISNRFHPKNTKSIFFPRQTRYYFKALEVENLVSSKWCNPNINEAMFITRLSSRLTRIIFLFDCYPTIRSRGVYELEFAVESIGRKLLLFRKLARLESACQR